MKKFLEEFKKFALRGNVMDMAIGIIIGGAFTDIVKSLTTNFINPILKFCTGGTDWKFYPWSEVSGYISAFVGSVLNFILMAFILFCLMRFITKAMSIGRKKKDVPKTKKICPFCKNEIDIDATRCGFCTSELDGVVEDDE